MSSPFSDADIQEGLLGNEAQMIRYVFYEHFHTMLRFNAQKAAGNKSVGLDDLIQELYLYMSRNNWEKLRKYSTEYPFASWFSVVSYRFFKDYTHSMIDSSRNLPIAEMSDHNISIAGTSRIETMMIDIKAAISKLTPPRDKEVVEAFLINEEEPAEIAQRLNVSVDNLYNIKRRALAKLIKDHLQEYVNR
ncbi:MAG: sigma-70 family RNA polymerase sigma factor [Bacteroidales bacterium]|nr:sigma-70 family RNA polymerase sigma factor [Bacteroidales bacterium]